MTAETPPEPDEPSETESLAARLSMLRGHTLPSRLFLMFVLALMGVLGLAEELPPDVSAALFRLNAAMRAIPFLGALLLWAAILLEQRKDRAACAGEAAAARRYFDVRLARSLASVSWIRIACLAFGAAVASLLFVRALSYTGRLAGWKAMCPALIAGVLVWEIVERRVRVRPEILELVQPRDGGPLE